MIFPVHFSFAFFPKNRALLGPKVLLVPVVKKEREAPMVKPDLLAPLDLLG